MILLETTETTGFWDTIGNFFVNIWEQIVAFFTVKPEGDPFSAGTRLFMALVFLIVFWFIVKLFIKGLRKAFKINQITVKKKVKTINPKTKKIEYRYVEINNSLRKFLVSGLNIILRLLVVIGFLAILKVKLDGIATIISSALLAVGLSMQDFIRNFFAGLVLISNKYVAVGDYCSVLGGQAEGTIFEVGAFSTLLNNVDGQQFVVPNISILNGVSKNYDKNPYRRVVIKVGVAYDSDIEKIKKILLNLSQKDARILKTKKDKKPSVVLDGFGPSGAIISLRMYVKKDIYWDVYYEYMELVLKALVKNKVMIPVNIMTLNNNEMNKFPRSIKEEKEDDE